MKKFNKPILVIGILASIIILIVFGVKNNNYNDDIAAYNAITSAYGIGSNTDISNYIKYSSMKKETEEKIEKNKRLPIVSICIFGGTILISFLVSGFTKIVNNVDSNNNLNASDKLKDLKLMLENNLISNEEYEIKKKDLLERM